MKYVAFVGTEGPMPEEALAVMNCGFPAYLEGMDRRGARLAAHPFARCHAIEVRPLYSEAAQHRPESLE